MPVEAIVLGLVCAVRPTAAAAIYALLCSRRPRWSLLVFLVAGFAFSATVGIAVVALLHGSVGLERTSTRSNIIDVALGAAGLGFAAGIGTGRFSWQPRDAADTPPSPWVARLQAPTLGMLVVAGIATHLPGILYLAALSVILGGDPSLGQAIIQVLIFNALWYSTGIAALAAFIIRPAATRGVVDAIRSWLAGHERGVLVVVFGGFGAYFVASGAAGLAGIAG